MYNNFYLRYNYKNIIPFNLKKNKLRVHASLIAVNKLQGFLVGHKIKFWYHYFGINNLKTNNTILVKKFLNKKLSVFFISNFNMIEGKWALPKIYENFYKKYSYMRGKKFNLMKVGFIINKDYSECNSDFYFLNKNKNNFINYFYLHYYYSYLNFMFFNFNKKISTCFKFEKNYKLPIFFVRNIKRKRFFKGSSKNFYKNKYKGSYNSEGFLNIYKKRNILKKVISDMYLLKLKNIKKNKLKWKRKIKKEILLNKKKNNKNKLNNKKKNKKENIKNKNKNKNKKKNNYIKKINTVSIFKDNKKHLINKKILARFFVLKNIINIIQFIKLFKEFNKYTLKNICFWFYKNYLSFKFIKLFNKKKFKSIYINKIIKNNYVGLDQLKLNLKKKKWLFSNLKKKKWKLNLLEKKKKKILFWIKKLYIRLFQNNKIKNYFLNIIKFKKSIINYYKFKINKLLYMSTLFNLKKFNIYYKMLGNVWWKYSNYSKVRRFKLLKKKKNKKLKHWFRNKFWIKENYKTMLLYKTYYRFLQENNNKRKVLNYINKLWNYNIFNYDYLWLRRKLKSNLYLNSFNRYNEWLNYYNNNYLNKDLNIKQDFLRILKEGKIEHKNNKRSNEGNNKLNNKGNNKRNNKGNNKGNNKRNNKLNNKENIQKNNKLNNKGNNKGNNKENNKEINKLNNKENNLKINKLNNKGNNKEINKLNNKGNNKENKKENNKENNKEINKLNKKENNLKIIKNKKENIQKRYYCSIDNNVYKNKKEHIEVYFYEKESTNLYSNFLSNNIINKKKNLDINNLKIQKIQNNKNKKNKLWKGLRNNFNYIIKRYNHNLNIDSCSNKIFVINKFCTISDFNKFNNIKNLSNKNFIIYKKKKKKIKKKIGFIEKFLLDRKKLKKQKNFRRYQDFFKKIYIKIDNYFYIENNIDLFIKKKNKEKEDLLNNLNFLLGWQKKLLLFFNKKIIIEKKKKKNKKKKRDYVLRYNYKYKKLIWDSGKKHEVENVDNIKKILHIITMIRDTKKKMQGWLLKRLNTWNYLKLKKEIIEILKIKGKIKKALRKKYYLRRNLILKNYIKKKWKKKIKFIKCLLFFKKKELFKIKKILYFRNRFNFMTSKYLLKWSLWLRFYKYRKYKYINKKRHIKRKELKFLQESKFYFNI